MSPALLVVFLFCQAQGTTPAPLDVTDLLRQWLNRPAPVDPPDEEQRTLVPTIGASPAAGVSFGVLLSQSRSAGRDVPLSVTTASASYSTGGRLVISARLDQQLGNAKWRLIGDWRLYDFTERTYGLGSDTTPATAIDAPLSWVRAHGTAYRNIARRLAVGGGYHLDLRRVEIPDGVPAPLEKETVVASGLSADAIFDSRDNTINATRGIFARLSQQWFPQSLGSARTWQSFQSEARAYWRLPAARRHVVALWTMAWLTTEGAPSYFDLPSTGWDLYGRTARGYPAGRFRGRSWIYGEAEYRVDLHRSGVIGAVAFVNTSTLSDARNHYGRWVPAGGIGLRLKLDKRHGSNLTVDYGWGLSGSRGLFLALNEAF